MPDPPVARGKTSDGKRDGHKKALAIFEDPPIELFPKKRIERSLNKLRASEARTGQVRREPHFRVC